MNMKSEYPMTEEEIQQMREYEDSAKAAAKTWLSAVPEGMAPHEMDYDSMDYETSD